MIISAGIALLAAWIVRGIIYAGVEFMPKINGAYYLVQARTVMETGRTGIPDLPLLFYLHATFAKLLMLLGIGDQAKCITLALKVSDTLLPPLTAIPAFILARDWLIGRGKGWLAMLAVVLFTVLNPSTFSLLADFQKNGFGMIWMLGFIVAVHCAGQHMSRTRLAWVGAMLLLAGATHIGVFGVTASFAALALVAYLALLKEYRKKLLIVLGIGLALIPVMIFAVRYGFDTKRADHLLRLIEEPVRLFQNGRESPGGGPPGMQGGARPGQPGIMPPTPGGMPGGMPPGGPPGGMGGVNVLGVPISQGVIIHSLAALVLILLIAHWRDVTPADRAIVLASMVLGLFLTSPFLDFDHGMRFGLMAFAPGAVMLAFALSHWQSKWGSRGLALLMITFTVLSSGSGLSSPMNQRPMVPVEGMSELASLKSYIPNPSRTLIVARHGLEWWVAWTLQTKIAHADAVKPEDFQRYEKVLYLQQSGGSSMMGPGGPMPGAPPGMARAGRMPGGPRGGPMAETQIPPDAHVLFKGKFYTLAAAASDAELQLDALKGALGADELPF
jgi:hypothetical protein